MLQWAALRESLDEEVQEDAAEGVAPTSTTVAVGEATATVLDADRVKLFQEPSVQTFVEWVQEEEEESSDEDGSEEGSEECSDEEEGSGSEGEEN